MKLPVFDNEEQEWRRRHNIELRERSGQVNIVDVVKSRRLQYAGHVARMEEGRIPKKVMTEGILDGRRFPGRPRMRWADNVKKDLESVGVEDVQDWRTLAQDRRTWRQLVSAVRGQQAARAPPE